MKSAEQKTQEYFIKWYYEYGKALCDAIDEGSGFLSDKLRYAFKAGIEYGKR